MLIGLPPIGSPPEWGLSIADGVEEGYLDYQDCPGRYVSVVLHKAAYTGIVISATPAEVFVYVEKPREGIVIKSAEQCTFVTVTGKKSADFTTMQHVKQVAQQQGVAMF